MLQECYTVEISYFVHLFALPKRQNYPKDKKNGDKITVSTGIAFLKHNDPFHNEE